MSSQTRSVALAAAVAACALVPLYGDPRSSPVTHAEWARMILRALDLEKAAPIGAPASAAFATLSWKNSLLYKAERYQRADGVEVVAGPPRRLLATKEVAEVVYPIAVVRGGTYRVSLKLKGNAAQPASVELKRPQESTPFETFQVIPPSLVGWIVAGKVHLDPGAYDARVMLPAGTELEQLEVAPPCLIPIEPKGGWQASAIARTEEVAETVIQAMDLQSELPPAEMPIEVNGGDFTVTTESALTRASAGVSQGYSLQAGPEGLQAMVSVTVPEAGLYTVSVFGIEGDGMSWLTDSCAKAVLCRTETRAARPEWHNVSTGELSQGPHVFTVTLANGAQIERLRLERKKTAPVDHLGTLHRLGLELGAEGPISRPKAIEAMEFIAKRKRTDAKAKPCGDIQVPATVGLTRLAQAAGGAQPEGPGAGTTGPAIQQPGAEPGYSGPAVPPAGPPPIPGGQPATPAPVTSPPTPTLPPPTTTTTLPPPTTTTLPPPPTTVATPPPTTTTLITPPTLPSPSPPSPAVP